MDTSIILSILSILLIIVGIIGTFLPVLPGLIICLGGLFLYKFGVNTDFPALYLWVFSVLTIVAGVLEYIIPARTTKKYGGTRWGSIGSVVGMIVGFFLPIPLGFLVGMFAGVFVGEMLHDSKDTKKALYAVKGAFIGFLYGTGFSFVVGTAMLLAVVVDIIRGVF